MSDVQSLAQALGCQRNQYLLYHQLWVENAEHRESLGCKNPDAHIWVLELDEGKMLQHALKVFWELTDKGGNVQIGVRSV